MWTRNLCNKVALDLVRLLRHSQKKQGSDCGLMEVLLKLFSGDTEKTHQKTSSFIWNGQYASTQPERYRYTQLLSGGRTSCVPRSRNRINCVPKCLLRMYHTETRPNLPMGPGSKPAAQRGTPRTHIHIKGKSIPLQASTSPEGSKRLRLPDFKKIGIWRW